MEITKEKIISYLNKIPPSKYCGPFPLYFINDVARELERKYSGDSDSESISISVNEKGDFTVETKTSVTKFKKLNSVISIYFNNHINFIFLDHINSEIFIFEPYGTEINPVIIKVLNVFIKHFKKYKVLKLDHCIQGSHNPMPHCKRESEFCGIFSLLFTDIKLYNPKLSYREISEIVQDLIQKDNYYPERYLTALERSTGIFVKDYLFN